MSRILFPLMALLAVLVPAAVGAQEGDTTALPWPIDEARLKGEYPEAVAYLAEEEQRCESERPGSGDCLHPLYLQLYLAWAWDKPRDAVAAAEKWLELAEQRDELGGHNEPTIRYFYASAIKGLVSDGIVWGGVGYLAAIEQLTLALERSRALDRDSSEAAMLLSARGDMLARRAAEEWSNEERRLALWSLAEADFRGAIAAVERSESAEIRTDTADYFADLARALYEQGRDEEAVLAAESALAGFRTRLEDPERAASVVRALRRLAVQAQEAGYPKVALRYWDTMLDPLADGLVETQVNDLLMLGKALAATGRGEDAIAVFEEALADPVLEANPMAESFLRGALMEALASTEDHARTIALAAENLAFADAQLAAGAYAPPFEAMRMKALLARGEALLETRRWDEAERDLSEARKLRETRAFYDPYEDANIAADLRLAKAVSRGSRDFALARTLLQRGIEGALAHVASGTGFDAENAGRLRSYAPLFREQVRIAFALARPERP